MSACSRFQPCCRKWFVHHVPVGADATAGRDLIDRSVAPTRSTFVLYSADGFSHAKARYGRHKIILARYAEGHPAYRRPTK
jgi:hypothetical protein